LSGQQRRPRRRRRAHRRQAVTNAAATSVSAPACWTESVKPSARDSARIGWRLRRRGEYRHLQHAGQLTHRSGMVRVQVGDHDRCGADPRTAYRVGGPDDGRTSPAQPASTSPGTTRPHQVHIGGQESAAVGGGSGAALPRRPPRLRILAFPQPHLLPWFVEDPVGDLAFLPAAGTADTPVCHFGRSAGRCRHDRSLRGVRHSAAYCEPVMHR
jgi:hypothetical protein